MSAAATVAPAEPCGVTLGAAWREWLDEVFGDRPGTYGRYELTLRRVTAHLDPEGTRDVATVTGHEYFAALKALWGQRMPATWNANRAAVSSFLRWVRDFAEYAEVKLPPRCTSRTVVQDDTKAVDREDLDDLWDEDAVPLRERALWRVMYESSSRAKPVLKLNVPDVDLKRRRARVRLKGGRVVWIHFGELGARWLGELIGDRTKGPVFLTLRRPWNWASRSLDDMGPEGCFRLSYNRAEEIFKEWTRALGLSGDGVTFDFLTLHQLRHSRLTHLAEDGTDTPMLQQISGHKDPRTLHRRYTRPSSAAVSRHMRLVDQRDAQRRRQTVRKRPVAARPRGLPGARSRASRSRSPGADRPG
ncbi:tyrosine-type recombinase/integrase [Streptomyces yaizuensis]|uniref:Site-specific integrase n=1 Tax=Streptomyces yaizuensis TaxID=2989713 RepID=A0AA86MG44_9ACTN|nr:tyrosine-type recombinase/integrase [Streptomyces sp. YSPA8]BDT39489.1 site-specific integrase [Streptomyces sp. YSPA8]